MFYEASANGKRRISVFSKFLPLSQNKKSTVFFFNRQFLHVSVFTLCLKATTHVRTFKAMFLA